MRSCYLKGKILSIVLKDNENIRQALSRIRKELKEGKILYNDLYIDEILEFLSSDDAKTRKNALLLISDIQKYKKEQSNDFNDTYLDSVNKETFKDSYNDKIVDKIFSYYKSEKTLFVRPNYLTALSFFSIKNIEKELKDILDEMNNTTYDIESQKHVNLEKHNLSLLLTDEKNKKVLSLKKPFVVLLTMNKHIIERKKEEISLNEKDINYTLKPTDKINSLGIRTTIFSIEELYNNHLYRECLFLIPLKKGFSLNYDTIKDIFKETYSYRLIKDLFGTDDFVFRFRVELRGENDTSKVKEIAQTIEENSKRKFINNPSKYEFTFLFIKNKKNILLPYIMLPKYFDNRFYYRKHTYSASMLGIKAAEYVYAIKKYIDSNNRVIDAFCNSATLLIERCRYKTKENYGVDIYNDAIKGGKINASLKNISINFINRNYFDFTSKHPFEEIFADFPDMYGKDFSEKEFFYKSFFDESLSISKDNTMIFAISNEDNLIKKNIRLHKCISLLEIIDIGYEKKMFVLKVK